MKTIKIEIPEGFKISTVDEKTGEVIFTPLKTLKERIKTFNDVCKELGKNPKNYVCTSDDPDDIAANALKQALLISRLFNQGKPELDWSNGNQPKYFLFYEFVPGSGWSLSHVVRWRTHSYCGSRLAFADENDALLAWELFSEIYIKLIK